MLKSAVYVYLIVSFVFYSVSSSAFSKKIHILIGNVDGAKVAHFDDMELISFWFKERGIGVVTHFAAVESDLEEVLLQKSTVGVIWIGHSSPHGGVLGADGNIISKSMFTNMSPSIAAITFVSCCAKSDVLPFYRNGEDRPEIDVFYFDAPETGGVIYFDMHMRAFFRREGIWSELLSSINDHQPRLPSCRQNLH